MTKNGSPSDRSSSSVEAWMQSVDGELPEHRNSYCEPPAYSPAEQPQAFVPDAHFCCAFRKLGECLHDSPTYNELLRKPAKYLFLCWVALCRTNDHTLPPSERRSCPMTWCDFVAQDNEGVELINHLSGCSKLSEGQYRCPYCMRPEFFMEPETSANPHRHLRRQFLKHAFDAICRIGSKRLRKAIHPHRAGTIRERFSKKRRHGEDEYIPELPARDVHLQSELDSTTVKVRSHAPAQPKPRGFVPRQAVAELSSTRTRYFELPEQEFSEVVPEPRAELPETRFSYLSTEMHTGNDQNPESPLSPVSPVSTEAWLDTENFDSPISPAHAASYKPWAIPEELSDADVSDRNVLAAPDYRARVQEGLLQEMAESWKSRPTRLVTRSYPQIRVDTSCSNAASIGQRNSPSTGDGYLRNRFELAQGLNQVPSPLQIEAETRSPVRLVEELRGLFNNFFKLTCAKLSQPPMSAAALSLFGSYPSAAMMLEAGLLALHKVIQGVLPNTVWDVFSLSHLAYACALANQETDLVERFPEIYRDLVRWAQAITSEQEKADYLQLVRELFDPSSHCLEAGVMGGQMGPGIGFSTSAGINSDFSFSTPLPPAPWATDILPHRPGQLGTMDHDFMGDGTLLHSLRKGITIRLCLQYIGAFEYLSTNTGKNNDPCDSSLENVGHSPQPNLKTARTSYLLRKNVIDQLMVIRGVESFRFVIDNAAMMLSTMPCTTLREIEMYLIQEGKAYAKSQSLYRKFVSIVSQVCDRASTSISWGELPSRDYYYLQDINQLQSIHHELLITEHAGDYHQPPRTQYLAEMGNNSSPATAEPSELMVVSDDPDIFSWTGTSPTVSADTSNLLLESNMQVDPNYATNPRTNLPRTNLGARDSEKRLSDLSNASSSQTNQGGCSSAASDSAEGQMTCQECGKVLQGKLIYLQSNMKRHVRELHSPVARKLVCSVAGCGRAFRRNHNLQHHQRTVHQVRS